MELRHLRYFVAVAEEMNFTRAAERLHIGQPPLSQQIQALEAELGVQLFSRGKRKIALTDAGALFLTRARAILAAAVAAGEEARRVAQGEEGELRIGFTSTLPLTPILPAIVQDYRRLSPKVRLHLREMYTADQFDGLLRDKLDVGFVRYDGRGHPAGLRLQALRRDPLLLVMPASHPLAGLPAISLAQCRDEGFVAYPDSAGTGLKDNVRLLCARAGFVPRVAQEAGEAITQIGLVAAGLGVAILPAPLDCVRIAGVRYLPLLDEDAFLVMAAATREDEQSPRVLRFIDGLAALAG
ncbi:LysR family transcriptional regulator [Chitinimonas arctica]|uniref:LysR family transcriptional regulator n=1 Tax=Chitinimonas arctica TaxID=2594795 RepID=A0A516SDB3_9NEIS|nr:LysR family transcriptional regulator [Chitinimonas arctica]QDQ26147.1 LysR family transcriptional regulator [Chitinimonas arctica]